MDEGVCDETVALIFALSTVLSFCVWLLLFYFREVEEVNRKIIDKYIHAH